MFRTGAQMSLLVLLTGCLLLWLSRSGPVRHFDDAAGSRIARLHGWGEDVANHEKWLHRPPPVPVTLVAIDDASIANHPWPWSPLEYSLFVQAALPFQPEVLAIDEVLEWDRANLAPAERQKLPQYEKILGDSLLRAPKVVLAAELGWPEDPNTIPPPREAPILRHVRGDLRAIPEWTVIEHEPKDELRTGANLGFTNLPESAHPVRSVPLVLRYQGRVVPALPLQAIILWQKLSADDVEVVLGSEIKLGSFHIPIDVQGEMRVNFGTPHTVNSFDDLLLAAEQTAAHQKVTAPVDRLKAGVALLARTDHAAPQLRLGNGRAGTGGQLYAAAIATIQAQSYLHRVPIWVDWLLIGGAVLVALWVPRWKKKKVALWSVLAFAAYLILAFVLFWSCRLVLPIALPLGLTLFIALYRLATPDSVWNLSRPVIL
jgi:hypothetical protein